MTKVTGMVTGILVLFISCKIIEIPPTPDPPEYFSETSDASSITLIRKNTEHAKKYSIYNKSGNKGWTSINEVNILTDKIGPGPGWSRIKITGLDSNTWFEFYMTAKNSSGESGPGAVILSRTLLKTPAITGIGGINDNTVKIEFMLVPGGITYGIFASNLENDIPGRKVMETGDCSVILEVEAKQFFRIQAYSVDNISAFSVARSAGPKLSTPVFKYNNNGFFETSGTANSFPLSWNEVGNATRYEVRYHLAEGAPADLAKWKSEVIAGTQCSTTVNGLQDDSEYVFIIRALSTSNDSLFSDPVTGITRIREPSFFRAESITSKTVQTQWEDLGARVRYILDYSTSPDMGNAISAGPLSENRYLVSGLGENTRYFFRLRSFGGLLGEFSEPLFLDRFTLHPKPLNLEGQVTDTKADVSWGRVENASGYVTAIYNESMTPLGTSLGTVNETRYLFERLNPNTTYKITVTAVNITTVPGLEYIEGETSDPLTVKTLLSTPAKPTITASAPGWLSLAWPPVNGADYYIIFFSTTDFIPLEEWQTITSPVNSVTIPNLTRDTVYHIRLIAMTAQNYSLPGWTETASTISSEIFIYFIPPTNHSDPVLQGMPDVIRQTNRESFTVTVETAGWDNYFLWYLDGEKKSQTGNTFTVSYNLPFGPHVLTVIATKNAIPFGTSAYFKVIN